MKKNSLNNNKEKFKNSDSSLEANFTLNNTDDDIELKEIIEAPSFLGLFRFTTKWEKFLLIIGFISAIASGAIQPLSNILIGDLTQVLVTYSTKCVILANPCDATDKENLSNGVRLFAIWNSVIGIAMLITAYIGTETFSYIAVKQVFRVRSAYLNKLFNKDIPWFDVHNSGDFASRMTDDLSKFEEGIGEKIPLFVTLQGTFFAAIILALKKGWKLALICLVSLPVSIIVIGFIAFLTTKFSAKELDAYGNAGSIAEEVLTSIRTVIAFGGEKLEKERYDKGLIRAKNNNIRRHFFEASGFGSIWLCIYGSYGFAFWYGIKLMLEGDSTYTPGNMITIFFSVMAGNMSFGIASPFIEAFAQAKAAGGKIFHIIDEKPVINRSKNIGKKLEFIKGNIELQNLKFQYPSRKEVAILNSLSLTVKAGETVALVGSSGCGKSTVLQLVQRFYDPLEGNILVDGHDIKDLNLTFYRQNIGVVSQEPVLFGTTIGENIRFGNKDAKTEDIISAAKMANAHYFIKGLPNGYDTLVGERGAQLSGGQKQRIAIARALIRNPAILLLDEATSALDTNSEAKVQAALDKASQNRTTIIVAHRLSTIRGANKIVVISNGKVVEQGSHVELMNLGKEYYNLVTTQVQSSEEFLNNRKDSVISNRIEDNSENEDVKSLKNLEEDETDTDNYVKKASLWSVTKLNSPEWYLLLLGTLGATAMGASMPIFSIIFGNIIQVLANPDTDYVKKETNKFCLYFFYAGILSFFSTFFQMYMFGRAGQILTQRIRSKMFEALLKQEISYFDRKENGVGSLCAKLSNEAALVQGATGQRIGAIMNSLATLVLSLLLAAYYEWRLGLVALAFFPVILCVTFLQRRQMSTQTDKFKESLERSTKIAVEAVGSIRTVVSLGCEETFFNLYINELIPHIKTTLINTHGRALVLGLSRAIMPFAFSTCMYYGGHLIITNNVPYGNVFTVSQALIMGTTSIGNSLAFTPNLEKGLQAAKIIMNLINRIPKVRNSQKASNKEEAHGELKYDEVHFSYPTRDSIQILKGLNLEIIEGKTVALVGPSGCGKSTIIQLLERFYDPNSGNVFFDKNDIKEITLNSLRSHLGIVSQEPNLFSRTISENIAYGDNSRSVTEAEIIEAAKQANSHNFITQLPHGYDTKLGEKGTQLSGGQKQRIAIARALIRNPKILLLDEATSALDAESEKVVQNALDYAKQGRTCLTIAHRLTTIQDADLICVINNGIVAEQGNHKELIEKRGLYYKLHSLQHS